MKRIPKEVWLTPQEVGQMAGGFTAAFIRLEIKAGALKADYLLSKRGRLGRYRIRLDDARAYTMRLSQPQQPQQPQ
jgi:hypothetical protein